MVIKVGYKGLMVGSKGGVKRMGPKVVSKCLIPWTGVNQDPTLRPPQGCVPWMGTKVDTIIGYGRKAWALR